MKALIDTCVIIDALQTREPFDVDAKEIFRMSAKNHFEGYITAKSVTDIYYLCHKMVHDDQKTREILAKLFLLFDPIDTQGIDCRKAIISETSDYEDAVMIETAYRSKMDCIVTRNVEDYKHSLVKILTPAAFLMELRQSYL